MLVRDVMTPRPTCCRPDEGVKMIASIMQTHNCGLVPIVNSLWERKLLGVITDRDLVLFMLAGMDESRWASARICDLMTGRGEIWTVRPEAEIFEVMGLMEDHQVHRIIVTAADGEVLGIVSLSDIARTLDCPEDLAKVVEAIYEPRE